MRRSITVKMIFSFLSVSFLSLILVVSFTRWFTGKEFQNYIFSQDQASVLEIFANYYAENGSWTGIDTAVDRHVIGQNAIILLNNDGNIVWGERRGVQGNNAAHSEEELPVVVDGEQVGLVVTMGEMRRLGAGGEAFLQRLDDVFLYSLLFAALLALLLGLLLSRYLTRPIRELTAATRAVADGDHEQIVPVRSKDELGELADSFNRMNEALANSLDLRRQMTADIAHELRTPLSIILGHAEGIHDGVLPLSLDTVDIIREEASRLDSLVEDLRTLSRADAGELPFVLESVSPKRLLEEIQSLYALNARQNKITLTVDVAEKIPEIKVDLGRMIQVLSNLLGNALRYTPENGQISIFAASKDDTVEIRVQDSGPGLSEMEIKKIFNRFYRTDSSRQRDKGGSGLGLAISKSIVEGHGGQIWAESAEGQGLTIVISLPC